MGRKIHIHTLMKNEKLVAVSARIPKSMHQELIEIQGVLGWSSIQFISKSIEMTLAQIKNENTKDEPDDLKVARFTYNLKKGKKST